MYDQFAPLLERALTEPGIISAAYRRFHRFSIGNQILAAIQLDGRGLPLSPIASFGRWKTLGRSVRRGEKALSLWMPIAVKRRPEEPSGEVGDAEEVCMHFRLAPRWFSLEQTEGADYSEPVESPDWHAETALAALDITPEHFDCLDGNVLGYAVRRRIAVSRLAEHPHSIRFHEMAHVLLGHTLAGDCQDAAAMPRDLREVEAEGVAYLLCSILDLPGREESRGYIQHWFQGGKLPEKSAQRIFKVSQQILAAGRPPAEQP